MRQLGSGVTIPQINNYDIAPLVISYPTSKKVQSEIVNLHNELLIKTQHLESIYQKKLTALIELKQSILQKAFAGELTTDAVNQHLEN